jgi:phage baseplate assembly protein gpV
LAQGVVLLGAYSDHMDAPADAAGVEFQRWSESEFAEYRAGRRTIHTEEAIVLEVGGGCTIAMGPDSITLSAGGAVLTIAAGRITSNVDILAQGISAVHHKHGGVRQGLDTSEVPQ